MASAALGVSLIVASLFLSETLLVSAFTVDYIQKTILSHQIVIFSKSYCPYSLKAKAIFKEMDQEPYVIELDERYDGNDIQDALNESFGRRTVPQVFIDGVYIGGSDDTVEAYKSGKLSKLLGQQDNADKIDIEDVNSDDDDDDNDNDDDEKPEDDVDDEDYDENDDYNEENLEVPLLE